MTVDEPRWGKPLEVNESQGRYRAEYLERAMEEQVVEVVRIGMDGAEAGGGKPVLCGLPACKRRREAEA